VLCVQWRGNSRAAEHEGVATSAHRVSCCVVKRMFGCETHCQRLTGHACGCEKGSGGSDGYLIQATKAIVSELPRGRGTVSDGRETIGSELFFVAQQHESTSKLQCSFSQHAASQSPRPPAKRRSASQSKPIVYMQRETLQNTKSTASTAIDDNTTTAASARHNTY
jgi:hypothetical protein